MPQHLIGVEVIEEIGDAMDLQRFSFDLLRRGFGVEAARVKLSVANPSPELEQVMREAVDVLSGAMDAGARSSATTRFSLTTSRVAQPIESPNFATKFAPKCFALSARKQFLTSF